MSSGPDFGRYGTGRYPYSHSRDRLSSQSSLRMIGRGVRAAAVLGVELVICTVDSSSTALTVHRMDGAMQLSVDLAINKAKTAVITKQPTHRWYNWLSHETSLGSTYFPAPFLPVPGGYPLIDDGAVVGGVGVSGSEWQDIVVAYACVSHGGFWEGDISSAIDKLRQLYPVVAAALSENELDA